LAAGLRDIGALSRSPAGNVTYDLTVCCASAPFERLAALPPDRGDRGDRDSLLPTLRPYGTAFVFDLFFLPALRPHGTAPDSSGDWVLSHFDDHVFNSSTSAAMVMARESRIANSLSGFTREMHCEAGRLQGAARRQWLLDA